MPHFFANRPRVHNVSSLFSFENTDQQEQDDALPSNDLNDAQLAQTLHETAVAAQQPHFNWERINAVAYAFGGILFIIGSVFFLPEYDSNIGSLCFLLGSMFYLLVVLHDCAEVYLHAQHQAAAAREPLPAIPTMKSVRNVSTLMQMKHAASHRAAGNDDPDQQPYAQQLGLEVLINLNYLVGTIMFTVGSVFFTTRVALYRAGAHLFIWGSFAFLAGAGWNVLMDTTYTIQNTTRLRQARLTTITATFYVIGSVLFLVASVPYLWDEEGISNADQLYTFLAWQYIVGSVLFLAGGWCNYGKAKNCTGIHFGYRHARCPDATNSTIASPVCATNAGIRCDGGLPRCIVDAVSSQCVHYSRGIK